MRTIVRRVRRFLKRVLPRERSQRVIPTVDVVLERILQAECPICYDTAANSPKTTTACAHDFCLACLITHIQHGGQRCPVCRTPLTNCRAQWRDSIACKTDSLDVRLRGIRGSSGGARRRSRTVYTYCHLPSVESDGRRRARSQFGTTLHIGWLGFHRRESYRQHARS
jgi:hypothetical protein